MQALFDYGARCAQSGRLWTTLDETMNTVPTVTPALQQTRMVDQQVECPVRNVRFAAVGGR